MPLVICVVSLAREKGKTSLIEQLTERFTSEGFGVVTVKHIHGSFDTAEKDTWRHLEAGATMTVASTPNEVITIRRSVNSPLEEALEAVYVESDLVLVEGYKRSPTPKILCADTASDVEAAVKEIPNVLMVSGPIASRAEERERLKTRFPEIGVYSFEELVQAIKERLMKEILGSLPGLNCGHCGYGACLDLAKAVSRGEATLGDCEVLATDIAALKVDGRIVPMGKFPQEVLRGVILGVLGSLKGVGESPKIIEVKIRV